MPSKNYHQPSHLSINKLQKEINQKLNKETNTGWEKFCNSVSLEKDPAIKIMV